MSKNLLIIIMNSDISTGAECLAPFTQALDAKALGINVEIMLCGRASKLAIHGVAEQLEVNFENAQTLLDIIHLAKKNKIKIYLNTSGINPLKTEILTEIDEVIDNKFLLEKSIQENYITYTY